MWRRQATGTVAEVFGRNELKRDIGARLHMFRGDLKAELNWYHPHGEAIIGVVRRRRERVHRRSAAAIRRRCRSSSSCSASSPAPWTPAVVISRHNALLSNIGDEVNDGAGRAALSAPIKVKDLEYFPGPEPNLTPDPAIDLSLIDKSILELYDAFRAPLRFGERCARRR